MKLRLIGSFVLWVVLIIGYFINKHLF